MFLGQHHATINGEDLLTVPLRFSGALSGGCVITQGFDRNLWVLPAATFQQLCRQISGMNITDPIARLLLRMLLGHASELELDQKENIQIPRNLREYADIQQEIVLIGQGDYFEVWDRAQWQKQENQLGDADANTERFSKLVIALSAL